MHTSSMRRFVPLLAFAAWVALAPHAFAGAQVEERLAPSVVMGLSRAVADNPVPSNYLQRPDVRAWLADMSPKLARKLPDEAMRNDFLATVHYEATRAGLDPQLVLGVIHHESNFRKYAISERKRVSCWTPRHRSGLSNTSSTFAISC